MKTVAGAVDAQDKEALRGEFAQNEELISGVYVYFFNVIHLPVGNLPDDSWE
jgi:hypothetical protein